MKMRSRIANDAAFDPTDRNAVMGVGAPSYTSGAHMWNGTAAILKPMPATTSTTASRSMGRLAEPAEASAVAIAWRLVEPVRPYSNDIPYSRMPRENAPSRKYFTAASFDLGLGFR